MAEKVARLGIKRKENKKDCKEQQIDEVEVATPANEPAPNSVQMVNLISHAIDKKPGEFAQTFDQLMKNRVAQAVADRKLELSSSLFGAPEVGEPEDEPEVGEPEETNEPGVSEPDESEAEAASPDQPDEPEENDEDGMIDDPVDDEEEDEEGEEMAEELDEKYVGFDKLKKKISR